MVSMKKIWKAAGAVCAATGVIALSGLIASGAAVGAVVEGFKTAADTMKKMLSDEPAAEEEPCEEAEADNDAAEN